MSSLYPSLPQNPPQEEMEMQDDPGSCTFIPLYYFCVGSGHQSRHE